MASEPDRSALVFRRTASYRWIGAPACLLMLVVLCLPTKRAAPSSGWDDLVIAIGLLSVVLGLWLPSRWAVAPFRVLSAFMAVWIINSFFVAWRLASDAAVNYGGWWSVLEHIERTHGLALVGIPALWFAVTGRVGWREDQRPIII